MTSSAFLLNGVTPSGPQLYAAGATVTASLSDMSGAATAQWSFIGASDGADLITYPTLTNSARGTVTFTVPAVPSHGYGLTLTLQCVNGDSVTRALVCAGSTTQLATYESFERDSVRGWTPQLNANSRPYHQVAQTAPVSCASGAATALVSVAPKNLEPSSTCILAIELVVRTYYSTPSTLSRGSLYRATALVETDANGTASSCTYMSITALTAHSIGTFSTFSMGVVATATELQFTLTQANSSAYACSAIALTRVTDVIYLT
jgi:hypothetical protein